MAALAAPTMDFSGSANAPVYAEDAAAAQDAYSQAQTTIAAKRGQIANQAGVTTDPSGAITGIDGNNPTGQYQQMEKAQGMQLEASHEANAGRGIGSAGIAAQPDAALRYGNSVAGANFGNNLLNANQTLTDVGTSAFGTYQNALLNLQLQSIADARSTQNFPTAPNGDSGGGDAGGSSSQATGGGPGSTSGGIASSTGKATPAQIKAAVAQNPRAAQIARDQGSVINPPVTLLPAAKTAKNVLANIEVQRSKLKGATPR